MEDVISDDEDGEFPDTGAGIGENDAATGPGTEDDAGDELPAPSHVREASDGGELREPAAPQDGAQNMKSGVHVTPSDQEPASSEVSTSVVDTPDPDRLEASNDRIEGLSVASRDAVTLQGDERQVASSEPVLNNGQDDQQTSREDAAIAAELIRNINVETLTPMPGPRTVRREARSVSDVNSPQPTSVQDTSSIYGNPMGLDEFQQPDPEAPTIIVVDRSAFNFPEPEMEKELEPAREVQPDTNIMQTPTGGPHGGADKTPLSTGAFFKVVDSPTTLTGDVRRDTLDKILNALDVKTDHIKAELHNVAESPVEPTPAELVNASMNLIKRGIDESKINHERSLDRLREMQDSPNMSAQAVHELDQELRKSEEELRESRAGYENLVQTYETSRHDSEEALYRHQQDMQKRRQSAIHMSKDAADLCKKYKDKGGTMQNTQDSTRHFEQSVHNVRHKMSNNTIMGLDDVVGHEHLGETAKALGGDEFPRLVQQKYDDAGKPLCNGIEAILLNTLDPLIFLLDMKEDGIQLIQGLCKKAAYSIELFCWQTTRDIITDDVIPRTDKRFAEMMSAMENVPDHEMEPKFIRTFKTVITEYADILARLQRSVKNCAGLTRDESILQDKMDDLQAEGYEILQKYPSKEVRRNVMADYDKQMGTIQDRREKSMKSMKARENQISLLFSEHYYVRSEWSTKTISNNPLKAMSTLNISGGGKPDVEQAELFMSNVWALMTAYPKQFSVLIPVFYAMREQFAEDETIWVPPINDQEDTFTNLGMNAEYRNMYFTQDRLLYDMIRVIDPALVLSTQQVRMIKIKGKEEIQYYATQNSGIGAIFHMIHPHMCMTKDDVNMLQRKIESMSGGFVSGPIMVKVDEYRKILQKGKAAKIKVGYHELVRKCAMRIQNRVPAAYSITSRFIAQELPTLTYDSIGNMDLFLGQISEMFRQYGISDDPPAAANYTDGSLNREQAMYMAAHSSDMISTFGDDDDDGFAAMAGNDRQNSRRGMGAKPGTMGTWKCQTHGCGEGIMERTQQRIEYARKQQGITGMPQDIICSDCYGKLLDGASMKLKDGSTKTPSAGQIELGKRRKAEGPRQPYVRQPNGRANLTTIEDDEKKAKAKQKNIERKARIKAAKEGSLNAGDMAAMHVFMRKMTAMQSPIPETQFDGDEPKTSVLRGMKNDYTTGLAALTEYSRMKKLHDDNPWEKASGYMTDGYAPKSHISFETFENHTCINENTGYTPGQTAYNRSLHPAGSNDIMLGRNLGSGCQLKYADSLFQISYMCTDHSPLPGTSVSDDVTLGEIGTQVTVIGWVVPDNPAIENSTSLVTAMGWPAEENSINLGTAMEWLGPATTPKMISDSTARIAAQQVTPVVLHENPDYDHGRHPAGPNDVRLGRRMGQGCQL